MRRIFELLCLGLIVSCINDPGRNDGPGDYSDYTRVPLQAQIQGVQPMTGIVIWSDNAGSHNESYALEYSYMRYSDICKQKDVYDWAPVEKLLSQAAARGHQTVLRFYYTYVGKQCAVPDYIKASQKFKMMAIKTYVERCRLSSLCGFEMLQFADCLKYENKNGIVDCFDDDKYIPANWMRQFNDDAVILADYPRENYRYGEDIRVDIFISDFLRQPYLNNGDLRLTLQHDGIEECLYDGHHITLAGGLQKIATLTFALRDRGQAVAQ